MEMAMKNYCNALLNSWGGGIYTVHCISYLLLRSNYAHANRGLKMLHAGRISWESYKKPVKISRILRSKMKVSFRISIKNRNNVVNSEFRCTVGSCTPLGIRPRKKTERPFSCRKTHSANSGHPVLYITCCLFFQLPHQVLKNILISFFIFI